MEHERERRQLVSGLMLALALVIGGATVFFGQRCASRCEMSEPEAPSQPTSPYVPPGVP